MFNTPFLSTPPQLSCPQECGSQHAVQQRALWSLELYFYLILFNYYLHEQVGLRERQPSYPSHRDPMGRALERNCVCARWSLRKVGREERVLVSISTPVPISSLPSQPRPRLCISVRAERILFFPLVLPWITIPFGAPFL